MAKTAFIALQNIAELEQVKRLLAQAGVAAVTSASSADAVKAVENSAAPFDLVFIDPETDRWRELAIRVKNRSLMSDVIAVANQPDSATMLEAGASNAILRPITDESAASVISNTLQSQDFRDQDLKRFHVDDIRSDWLELTASSELDCIERFKNFSDVIFQADLDEKSRRDLMVAVSELGQNAIEWGNQFDPKKKVVLSYAAFEDRVMLKIEDEGEGFDFRKIEDPTIDPMAYFKKREATGKRVGGYGVFLVHKLMDRVIYNEKGNIVIMTKKIRSTHGKKGG